MKNNALKNQNKMPNGIFKKQVFALGLCFSWAITVFCLLLGDTKNAIHSELATYSFLTGVAFVFALVFKGKINSRFFGISFGDEDKHKHDEVN